MFSLLGNLIFGAQDEAEELQTQEQIVSIQSMDASTQTLGEQQQPMIQSNNNLNKPGNETVKKCNDWILIDRSDNSCKYKSNSSVDNSVNTSIMMLDEQQPQEQNDFNVNKNSNNNINNIRTNTISYAKIVKANLKIEEDVEEQKEEDNNEKIVYTCATREQAMKANKMMIASNDSECLLGSFFERNTDEIEMQEEEQEEEEQQQETNEVEELMQSNKKEDWLITPLPCLTSITCSQRSIIENHPLENLLIEHPSMSVFVTATSTSSCDEDEEMRQIEENKEDLIEQQYQKEQQLEIVVAKANNKSAQKKKSNKKQQEDSLSKEVKSICSTRQIIQKAVAEKRNALSNIQFALNSEAGNLNKNSLPRSSIAKKSSKKIKKSLSPVNISNKNIVEIQDKENASQLLFVNGINNNNNNSNSGSSSSLNNSKQITNSGVQNKLSVNNKKKSEVSRMKKSQLNRVNKINTFSSGKNHSNKQQRKFHKLQQPAGSFSSGSQF